LDVAVEIQTDEFGVDDGRTELPPIVSASKPPAALIIQFVAPFFVTRGQIIRRSFAETFSRGH